MIRFFLLILAVVLSLGVAYVVLAMGAPVLVSELVGGTLSALLMAGALALNGVDPDAEEDEADDVPPRTRVRGSLKVTGPGRIVVRDVDVDGDIEVTSR